MARAIFIVGESGTGKSYSMRNVDPESTYIINVANKDLPFAGSSKKFNEAKKNYIELIDPDEILKHIGVIANPANKDYSHIKTLVIDDFQYIMTERFMKDAFRKGYDKFTELGFSIYSLIRPSNLRKMRSDLLIIFMTHSEVKPDGMIRVKTIGKMLDEKVTLDGLVTVCLHTSVQEVSPGEVEYKFMTRTDGICAAKTPPGMFKDQFIDNDLAYVIKRIDEYYNQGIEEK